MGDNGRLSIMRDQLGSALTNTLSREEKQLNLVNMWDEYRSSIRNYYKESNPQSEFKVNVRPDPAWEQSKREMDELERRDFEMRTQLAKESGHQSDISKRLAELRREIEREHASSELQGSSRKSRSPSAGGRSSPLQSTNILRDPNRTGASPADFGKSGRSVSPSKGRVSPGPIHGSTSRSGSPGPVRHHSYKDHLQTYSMDKLYPLEQVIKMQDLLIDITDNDFSRLPSSYVQELVKLAAVITHRVKTTN